MGPWLTGLMLETQDTTSSRPAERHWWRPLLWTLWTVSVVLVAVSAIVPVLLGVGPDHRGSLVRLFFDVADERNLPAWWNSGLLLLAAFFCAGVGQLRRRSGADGRAGWLAWWGIAALLGMMSLDEFAGVHEHLDRVWDAVVGDNPLRAYEWLMLGVPLGLAVVVFVWLCSRTLPRATARLLVGGLLVLFTGALVLEALPLFLDLPRNSVGFVAAYHAEELFEFIGSSMLVVAPLASLGVRRSTGGGGLEVDWVPAARMRADPDRQAVPMR